MLKLGEIVTSLVVILAVSFLEPQADSLEGNVQAVFVLCAALTLIATTVLMAASSDFNGRWGLRLLQQTFVFGVGVICAGGFLMRAFGSDIDTLGIWIYLLVNPLMYVAVAIIALAWIVDCVVTRRRQG